MAKFIIQPHGRLQEAVADVNGYFTDEGLDYEIVPSKIDHGALSEPVPADGPVPERKSGAYEAYEEGKGGKGGKSDISCACHWAVNQAAASDVGRQWGKAYVVTPGAIMVAADSDVRRPEDLAGKEIAVGYHSGSHFTTIQALEPFLKPDDIKVKFVGMPWDRVDVGVNGQVAATSLWGLSMLVGEQLGLRKIADCTFMITFMFPHHVDEADVEKYMNALKRAQMDIDLTPEKYKPLYVPMLPERYRDRVDVRLFSPGERIVFLPYTKETFEKTQAWIHERQIFETRPAADYDKAVAV